MAEDLKYNVNLPDVYREILSQKNKTIYVYTFPSLIFLGKRSYVIKKILKSIWSEINKNSSFLQNNLCCV